ncbi:hypothetical protein ABZT02_45940, partial [Streptomyces sp. NPDC005402]|uniref:hypothetical protein n=1 Tax=Streptomyces sp. NPDC005402 TaxID=3155338 RepID=UPI0033ADCE90
MTFSNLPLNNPRVVELAIENQGQRDITAAMFHAPIRQIRHRHLGPCPPLFDNETPSSAPWCGVHYAPNCAHGK